MSHTTIYSAAALLVLATAAVAPAYHPPEPPPPRPALDAFQGVWVDQCGRTIVIAGNKLVNSVLGVSYLRDLDASRNPPRVVMDEPIHTSPGERVRLAAVYRVSPGRVEIHYGVDFPQSMDAPAGRTVVLRRKD
jgi:hypothetical protein